MPCSEGALGTVAVNVLASPGRKKRNELQFYTSALHLDAEPAGESIISLGTSTVMGGGQHSLCYLSLTSAAGAGSQPSLQKVSPALVRLAKHPETKHKGTWG